MVLYLHSWYYDIMVLYLFSRYYDIMVLYLHFWCCDTWFSAYIPDTMTHGSLTFLILWHMVLCLHFWYYDTWFSTNISDTMTYTWFYDIHMVLYLHFIYYNTWFTTYIFDIMRHGSLLTFLIVWHNGLSNRLPCCCKRKDTTIKKPTLSIIICPSLYYCK